MTLDTPKQAGNAGLRLFSQTPQWPFVRDVRGHSAQESIPGDWGNGLVSEELATQALEFGTPEPM